MSFLDEISKLTTPAAALPDIEDEDHDVSSASKLKSHLKGRAKVANFNFEEGKYAGSKVSRQEMFGDMNEMTGLNGKTDSDDENDDEELDEEEVGDEESTEELESENDDQIESNDEGISDEEQEDEDDDEEEEQTNSGITKISIPTEVNSSTSKAECVQNQKKVWDDIMYTNIRMHALLNSANQLPRGNARKQLIADADETTKEQLATASKNIAKLRQLFKEACDIFNEKAEDDDDEEIPSDEDIGDIESEEDDIDEEDSESEENLKKSAEQGVSVDALGNFMKKHDEDFDKFRATTISKWYNRTKLLNEKSTNNADFSSFEKGSVMNQITKILSDEGKLLKKVRTNRSGKNRLGAKPEEIENGLDNEIFDDTDFYQQLLKQMIESRSNNTNQSEDGADMTRSYMELQKMFNNKKKRDVTSLSSKDRKLKYEPIAKLINFYPAKPSVVTWTHESRTELFKSLFS